MSSWKPEVQTIGDSDRWSTNAVRTATEDEAKAYVHDLMMRWTAVRDTRVVECEDPVSATYVDGRLEFIQ